MADPLPALEARSLVIRDPAGRQRIVLGLDDHLMPTIALLATDGMELASIRLVADFTDADESAIGSEVRLCASDGTGQAMLRAGGQGNAALELTDHEEAVGGLLCMAVENLNGTPTAGLVVRDANASVGLDIRDGRIDLSGGRR